MQGTPSKNGTGGSVAWLSVGALFGVVGAAIGLLHSGPAPSLPPEAVARVDGVLILEEDYGRLLAAVAQDSRQPVDETTRRRVLDRMIEEELLVRRALELGLARYDRKVRGNLVAAQIAAITAEVEQIPSREQLREFFEREREWFEQPARLHLRQMFFRSSSQQDESKLYEAARDAQVRLERGETFEVVAQSVGDPAVVPLPKRPLPPTKLIDYLGPTVVQAATQLEPGQVSGPLRSASGLHLILLVERVAAAEPDLESIEDQVRTEWLRRARDRALREYLEDLRTEAAITVREELP